MTVHDNEIRRFEASPRVQGPSSGKRQAVHTVKVSRDTEKGPSILYDARGVRVKKSKFSSEFVRTLLFFVLPYLIINGIIFILVTATPKIEVNVGNTGDYRSAVAKFTVSCLLPLREVSVTIDSEPLEFEKSGSSYTAEVTKNGTFYVEAEAINGMRSVGYTDVSVLDDMPPAVDETSCHIENGVLTFKIADTLSGVDWASLCATTESGEKVLPTSIDKENGIVAFEMADDHMEIHFTDLVGNARSASITATTEQLTQL